VYSDTLHINRDTSEGEHKTNVFKISRDFFPHIYRADLCIQKQM